MPRGPLLDGVWTKVPPEPMLRKHCAQSETHRNVFCTYGTKVKRYITVKEFSPVANLHLLNHFFVSALLLMSWFNYDV